MEGVYRTDNICFPQGLLRKLAFRNTAILEKMSAIRFSEISFRYCDVDVLKSFLGRRYDIKNDVSLLGKRIYFLHQFGN